MAVDCCVDAGRLNGEAEPDCDARRDESEPPERAGIRIMEDALAAVFALVLVGMLWATALPLEASGVLPDDPDDEGGAPPSQAQKHRLESMAVRISRFFFMLYKLYLPLKGFDKRKSGVKKACHI
ncbi:MAG: hypothetical protein INR69_14645 [Mucilaginibacter polytrichastri]|nr:hypothetical protein [Mucilaginibacter polytrichastri]